MTMFILGMLMGSGLVLLVEELQFQNWLRHELRVKEQDKAWETPLPSVVGDTCYCHASWDDHEKWMLEGTTPVTSTSDTEWWDVMGVDGKPSGIKMSKPEDGDDYW